MTALAIARIRHRPLAVAACAAFAALMTGGLVNALFLQTQRHPAPLFRTAPAPAPVAHPVAPAPKVEAAAPKAEPARETAAAPAHDVLPPPRPADLGQTRSVEAKRADAKPHADAIGSLLRAGAPAAETTTSTKTVIAAQKALAKLGYDIKPDGQIGAQTRQAIERFERSQKLPVTGEFGARNLKKLSAASGLTVQ